MGGRLVPRGDGVRPDARVRAGEVHGEPRARDDSLAVVRGPRVALRPRLALVGRPLVGVPEVLPVVGL